MIKLTHEVKSRELQKIFETKINSNSNITPFFSSLSKVTTLHGLTCKNNLPARIELFNVVLEIDRLTKKHSKNIKTFSQSLSEFNICLATEKEVSINVSNAINYAIYELIKNVDLIYQYDHLVLVRTGKPYHNSIFREYLSDMKQLIAKIFKLKIGDIASRDSSQIDKSLLKKSLTHPIMPEIMKSA